MLNRAVPMLLYRIDRWLPWAAVCILVVCPANAPAQKHASPELLERARNRMVDEDVVGAGVKNSLVIQSMRDTPRHEFVLPKLIEPGVSRHVAADRRTPNYFAADVRGLYDRAVGSAAEGSRVGDRHRQRLSSGGAQSVGKRGVHDRNHRIAGKARKQTLNRLKYTNVFVKIGDGYQGWPEHAPFDKIIVTCSPEEVPQPLIDQLKEGGRMIIPVGERYQQVFHLLKKQNGELVNEALRPALFVPMTGKAEESRQVQPDPLHPKLINGGFEEVVGTDGQPTGWYYVRQMKVVTAPDAPEGQNYVTFSNSEPGRASRAVQGFPIDGRKVHDLELSCMVRGAEITPGSAPDQKPQLAIMFLDENRSPVGHLKIGPWEGTFAWQRVTGRIRVPPHAREGIVNIGLLGATGEVSVRRHSDSSAQSEKRSA